MDGEVSGPIERWVRVDVPRARAFKTFGSRLQEWWPAEYTWSGESLEGIGIEGREGGRCWEVGPDGFRCDWGTVVDWQPPRRLRFLWQIGPDRTPVPDPTQASEVEVVFEEEGPESTQVTVVHRGFARHGQEAEEYRAGMASPAGWTYLLDRFAGMFS